eukprot:327808-Pleurochrysis_carterae.AAC.4
MPELGRCVARRTPLPTAASEASLGACERACTGASWADGVMVASVSSMCSRRASYIVAQKTKVGRGSRVGMSGPNAASSGALRSLALAASQAKKSVSL